MSEFETGSSTTPPALLVNMSEETSRGGGGGKVPPSLFSSQQTHLSRKVSDAALYGFNRPQEIEEMKPEREPLQIYDESIPAGEERVVFLHPVTTLTSIIYLLDI